MKKVITYLLLGSLAVGGISTVLAQTTSQNSQTQQNQMQDPAYTGTIATVNDQTEAQEAERYAALAKITAEQAVAAAQQAAGVTDQPTKVALESENGYLVWEVVLAGQEYKVDAGNGSILHSAAIGAGEAGEGGENESAEDGN